MASEVENCAAWRDENIAEGKGADFLLNRRWCHAVIQKIDIDATTECKVLCIEPKMHGMYPTDLVTFKLSAQTQTHIAPPLTKSMEHCPHMMQWRKDLSPAMNDDESPF